MKYSQSIHDLSHIPERDKWPKKSNQGNCDCSFDNDQNLLNPNDFRPTNNFLTMNEDRSQNLNSIPSSCSVPTDLQLCGCYMQDIAKNTTQLSHIFNTASLHAANVDLVNDKSLSDLIRPRKLKLDKTLAKYKLHKSLPVSPVSEERSFSDFAQQQKCVEENSSVRKSFSYFIDLEEKADTNEGFKQICSDIEKFSQDFNRKYELIGKNFETMSSFKTEKPNKDEEEGNFSSDSLEEYSFRSVGTKKFSNSLIPRRCVSSNELCKYEEDDFETDDIPKSESFYLNPNIRSSQDSILSDDNLLDDCYPCQMKSSCNSMESILSNDSDCKSAPLEALFAQQKKFLSPKPCVGHSQSLPKNLGSAPTSPRKAQLKTSQTQTDFATPQEIVAKKSNASAEFQEKLLRFETIAKKPVTFFVETDQKVKKKNVKNRVVEEDENTRPVNSRSEMYIPSLETKNKQYKSKFCNVLNNKPEFNIEIFESSSKKWSSATLKFPKNTNKKQAQVQETSSLDRHLFTKSPIGSEKVCHKPPKAVRRHSSKTRKTKMSYEYIKKEDFYSMKNNKKRDVLNNRNVSDENTIELSYKEKNIERDLETGNNSPSSNNNLLTELYDSLDKSSIFSSKIDQDSLEVNLKVVNEGRKIGESVNVWNEMLSTKFDKSKRYDSIQFALENIKILNEIEKKIQKINYLVDVFKKNLCSGKVRALSRMYENMTSYYNDLTRLEATPIRFRRRNLSLPSFVERHLNYESKVSTSNKIKNVNMEGASGGDFGMFVVFGRRFCIK